MTIQEPAWLKRTRPCPFFSQGRCLFADSCNFLHDVKVRNAVNQPLLDTVPAKQSSPLPKPVFDPPSVVVNTASPRSVNQASPESLASTVQDSSRYSGLLSVLSDVIGPPSNPPTTAEAAVPGSRAMSTVPSGVQSTAHDRTSLPSESDSVVAGSQSTGAVAVMRTDQREQGTSNSTEQASIHQSDDEATLVDPPVHYMESLSPGLHGEFLPIPDNEESTDVGATSYVVEDTETYVIGSEGEEENDEDKDVDHGEEDPTVVMSNRQSTLSSFTGASLLASPRNSVFEGSSPIGDGVDLLSPVQLSAKLRPFPIPSEGSRIKRGVSIDSGYADADGWVGPIPFPRSPPRSFWSSVTFPTYPRRASHSSPATKNRRISYDVGALRPPRDPIEVIEEVEVESSEDNEDTACTILGAYDQSPSEEQEEEVCDHLQVNVVASEETAEEDEELSETSAARRYSTEHLHSTRECDLNSCSQPSFVSDDNLSFRTALSTQPSYEGLSDISKASPVKQDSLLSSISGCSTPNTSVLSQYGDANEFLEQFAVGSHSCKSTYLVSKAGMASQIDSSGVSEANALEERSLSDGDAIDLNVLFTSASADDLQGPVPKVVAPRGRLSGVFHFDARPPTSSPSVDTSHGRSLVKDSSPLTKDAFNSAPSRADGLQQFAPENASREPFPSILHFDRPSPKSSPSAQSPSNPTSCQDVLGYASPGASGVQECGSKNVVSWQKYFSGVSDFDKRSPKPSPSSSPSVKDAVSYVPQCGDGRHNRPSANVASPWEHLSGAFHFDKHLSKPVLSTESSQSSSPVKDIVGCVSLDADGENFGPPERSPCVLYDDLADCDDAGQSLVAEDSLGSDESFDSENDSFTRRLSFPLSPPVLLADFVGDSTLSSEERSSVPSEAAVANLGVDGSSACTVSQHEEVQRIRSGSDQTEKARPSQLPPIGSPDRDSNFTLRRARAASDLTVKGKSPLVTTPRYTPCILKTPSSPLEQPGRSDSVQSLYDQYFDDCTSDDDLGSLSPPHRNTPPPDVTSPRDEPFEGVHPHPLDLISHVPQTAAVPCCDTESSNSGTDFLRSETVFRPFLTGRRSSLAELVPKANLANAKQSSSPTHLSIRLQVREIGSTMVPLGFRRHKPGQPAATQSLRSTSQPLHTEFPSSGIREVLRIRTDLAVGEDSHPGCSSAGVPLTTRSPLPVKSMSAPPTGGLRQLRLSSIINKRSSILSTNSSSIASSTLYLDHIFNSSTPQSPSVSSTTSFSRNSVLSSSYEPIPEQTHHTLKRSSSNSLILQAAADDAYFASQFSLTRRNSQSVSVPVQEPNPWRLSHYRAGSRNYTSADVTRRFSRRASTLSLAYAVDEEQEIVEDDSKISHPIQFKHVDDWMRPTSVLSAPVHAIATPKPTLLFAIASDNVDQVRQVLESGEGGPNDSVGPQSALAFTLTNDKLTHKQEIVKALLAYGANPSALRNPTLNPVSRKEGGDEPSTPPPETTLEGMDPATRYFVARADAAHTRQTSQLIYRSFFRPLTRVRYDVIGQDWALEQLFRVLSMHSQKLAVAPIVVVLCGPSGHGKSLLARKFGSLLDVPTHTVNMTTLRSAHDIWQSYSMSPYEEPSSCTLAEFLIENEGRRCVVVLDEIEKVEDQKALWSLLMPWELGRCSLEAGKQHVNARDVIWIGTSNVGHELVFEHHENRTVPEERMSREEYLELTGMLRPRVSHCLGASLVSRVTTVLPFVPFTLDEKKAIAAEAVYALAGDTSKTMSPQDVESLVMKVLPLYNPSEGARSLHRAISNILVDAI